MTRKLVVNTIEADTGISSVSFASSISMSSTSKFHFSAAGIDIDADTNINRPAAGVIGFNINGGEKVRIQSNGRVGISTNNPVSALHVLGTTHALGNGGASLVWGDTVYLGALTFDGSADNQPVIRSASSKDLIFQVNQSTEALRIKSGGQVIAGHTSTLGSAKLNVIGDSTTALADNAENFTRANDAFALIYNKNTGNVESGLTILSSGSAGAAYNMYVKKTGSYAGDLIFRSRTGASSSAERLRITSNGSVGIGTDTPVATSKLDVIDGIINVGAAVTTIDTRIQFTRKTTGSSGWIGIPNWDSDGLYIYGPTSNSNEIAARYTSGAWGFFTGGVDTAPRLNIDSSGQFALGRAGQITGNGNSSTSVFEQLSNSNYPLALHSSKTNKRGLMIFYATTGAGNAGDPFIVCTDNTNNKFQVTSDGTITNRGHILPAVTNDKDLGSSSLRWRNVYTTDLQLSNKGKTNDVDNTWGDYTIQEGECDLFLINNRNGKKYKFNLTEV